ncbi:MAG: PepSY domain-containing protein [Planctomycetota bacterium]|nr:PepSY domain-containing protein [Planctomycetota bacterium]
MQRIPVRVVLVMWWLLSLATNISLAQEWTERPFEEEIEVSIEALITGDPSIRVDRDGLGRTHIYGGVISRGTSEDDAVLNFLEQHVALFGVFKEDLEMIYQTDLPTREASVYAYRQVIDGVPVESSALRILVRPDLQTGDPAVVYAAGHLAQQPLSGYAPVLLTPQQATRIATRELPGIEIERWSEGELLIQASASLRSESRLLYRVKATTPSSHGIEDWSILIDPETGEVLGVRNDLVHEDVVGEVRGRVNQNNRPDSATNPAVEQAVGAVPVSISGSGSTTSALDGSFTCPHGGTAPVSLVSQLIGDWVRVENNVAANLLVSTPAIPPGPATVSLNPVADALVQSEVNAFHYTNITHDFFRDRTVAGNPGIDISILCNVNILDTCNAFFSPGEQSINFYQAGGGCVNTAYASVISHEYGHFVVNRLGLSQGGFGEGYGDLMSMLIYDDPIIGHDFQGPGTQVRNPLAANIQYPCQSTSVHNCGQILGAAFWRVRENFGAVYGSAEGLSQVQQLFVDWSLITTGGSGPSSAHPQTAIELLTLDDDDSSLDNGTPNYSEICDAFAQQSINCPSVADILISYPLGLPESLLPQEERQIRLEVTAAAATPDPDSGLLHVRQGPGAFSTFSVVQEVGGGFMATIPGYSCGDPVEYYFSFGDLTGGTHASPDSGAADPFSVPVYLLQEAFIENPMEQDLGWTVGAPSDGATTGAWTRVTPIGTVAAPGADHSEIGSQCWVTGQGSAGGGQGENDVDGGATTLFSSVMDLEPYSADVVLIEYWRWYVNGTGAAPYTDTWQIEITNDLVNWVTVEQVGPQNGPDTNGGWILHSFDPSQLISLTNTVRMRFVASDLDAGSIVEAGIDDFRVITRICQTGPSFRRGDSNGDGATDISDAVAILGYLFNGSTLQCIDAADVHDTGEVNISDTVALVIYLFGGGTPPAAPFPSCGWDSTPDPLEECLDGGSCP